MKTSHELTTGFTEVTSHELSSVEGGFLSRGLAFISSLIRNLGGKMDDLEDNEQLLQFEIQQGTSDL